jgi:hypothetical protein
MYYRITEHHGAYAPTPCMEHGGGARTCPPIFDLSWAWGHLHEKFSLEIDTKFVKKTL